MLHLSQSKNKTTPNIGNSCFEVFKMISETEREKVKKQLEEAAKFIRNNPDCDISEEELRDRIGSVSTEEGLELLSRILKVASGTEKREICTERVTFTAEVMKDTIDRLNHIYNVTGVTVGEQIDRLCFNFHPNDSGLAAQMICESIVAHTSNLDEAQFDLTMFIVLSMFSKVLEEGQDKNSFKRLVERAREMLQSKGIATLDEKDNE